MGLRIRQIFSHIGYSLVLGVVVLATACATAPVQQMSDARQKIQVAVDAGAEQYANSELSRSQDLLLAAQKAIDVRDFEKARQIALDAQKAADHAKKLADSAQMK